MVGNSSKLTTAFNRVAVHRWAEPRLKEVSASLEGEGHLGRAAAKGSSLNCITKSSIRGKRNNNEENNILYGSCGNTFL